MARSHPGSWRCEIDDFIRSITGALLFGIPLLYTMEMWWIATYLRTPKLLLYLGFAFVAILYLASTGTRTASDVWVRVRLEYTATFPTP